MISVKVFATLSLALMVAWVVTLLTTSLSSDIVLASDRDYWKFAWLMVLGALSAGWIALAIMFATDRD